MFATYTCFIACKGQHFDIGIVNDVRNVSKSELDMKLLAWYAAFLFSQPYCTAMALAVAEACLRAWLFPRYMASWGIVCIGITLVVLGEVIRKLAMVSARECVHVEVQHLKSTSTLLFGMHVT
jgi:hypothetical protein